MSAGMLLILLLILISPLGAHHSAYAECDKDKPVLLRGAVSKLDWINPHAQLTIDVSGANWTFGMYSPEMLIERGWQKGTIVVGQIVIVRGWQARTGLDRACSYSVIPLPSGVARESGPLLVPGN
jgi:hypothetical protein